MIRPAYFDPAPEPDTETQYRRGGKVKIMTSKKPAKKMPRKFAEGGATGESGKTAYDRERDLSIPAAESTYEPYKPSRMERVKTVALEAGGEVMRNLEALGPVAAVSAAGSRAARGAKAAKDATKAVKKYAKGGAVKGWGMARGARKAKVC